MSSIGLNVQQEIDNVIRESGQVSRDKVVDVVRVLLDEVNPAPVFDIERYIEIAITEFPDVSEDEIEVSIEVVNRILNRQGTTQP